MIANDIESEPQADVAFAILKSFTGVCLVVAKPDRYYGASPEQLDPRVLDKLGPYIAPSQQPNLPVLPNFFVAGKGPDGSSAVAKRQAGYNGVLRARAIKKLQSLGTGPARSNDLQAYPITTTYYVGVLRIHACHPVPSPNSTTPVDAPSLDFHRNSVGS